MRTIELTIAEVLGYGKLKPGWDGMHSVGPRKEMVKLVCEFLNTIPKDLPIPTPMISGSGVIGLYWDRPVSYIDIEFMDEEDISMLVVVKKDSRRDEWFPTLTVPQFTVEFFEQHFSLLKEEKPWEATVDFATAAALH